MKMECLRYSELEKQLEKMIESAQHMVDNGAGEKWQRKLQHLENAKNEIFKARYELE